MRTKSDLKCQVRKALYGTKDNVITFMNRKMVAAGGASPRCVGELALTSRSTEATLVEHKEPSTSLDTAVCLNEKKMTRYWKLIVRHKERRIKIFRPIMLPSSPPLYIKLQQLSGFESRERIDAVIWFLSLLMTANGVSVQGFLCPPHFGRKRGLTDIETKTEQEQFLAYVFLAGVAGGCLLAFATSRDCFPTKVSGTMGLPSFRMKSSGRNKVKSNDNGHNDGRPRRKTNFAQWRAGQVLCHCCGESGHLSRECPRKGCVPEDQWFICQAQCWNPSDNSVVSQRNGL